MNQKRNYIEKNLDIIKKLIDAKRPKMEIARVLGVKYETLKKYLKEFGINYEGNPNRRGIPHLESREVLLKYLSNQKTISASALRKKIIEEGLKEEKCEHCGLSEWMGEKIPLELHHINMNHNDNSIENLQILCPNCHSLVHKNTKNTLQNKIDTTFLTVCLSEKKDITNIEKKPKKRKYIAPPRYCKHCGKQLASKQKKFCSQECFNLNKAKRPSAIELIEKYREFGGNKTKLGELYGVSDKAVKKWLRLYKIED